MYSPSSPWRSLGDYARKDFVAALKGSPLEAEAGAIFDAVTPHSVLFRAHLHQESNDGREGIAAQGIHNPVGLRPRADGSQVVGEKWTGGNFLRFQSWSSAAKEWKARVTSASYAYATASSLADYIHLYCPDSDNAPGVEAAYVRVVLGYANARKETPTVPDTAGIASKLVPIRQQIIPWSNANRPGTKLQLTHWPIAHLTVHGTANHGKGTDAAVHANLVAGTWGAQAQASWHVTTDDHEAVQSVPLDEMAWHAGDGCNQPTVDVGCFASLAMEICVNEDGDLAKALDNAAQVFVRMVYGDPVFDWGDGSTRGKLDINHFDQHTWVSQEEPPHDCNYELRHEVLPPWSWEYWLGRVDYWYQALAPLYGGTTPATPPKAGDGNGSLVAGIRLPEGVDLHFLERRFSGSSSHKKVIGGHTYSFNPDGAVSRAWLRHCIKSTQGRHNKANLKLWPFLKNAEKVDAKHTKYTFSDGWELVNPPMDIKPKQHP